MSTAEFQSVSHFAGYRIVGAIGQGGMGKIFLGRREGLGGFGRLFAIKVVKPELASSHETIMMLLDEARIAARVSHPNVVSVHDVGEEDGQHYVTMDYVHGQTLSRIVDHLKQNASSLDPVLGAYIIASVAEGLHAAHELKDDDGAPTLVVHRDVSPGNILLGYDGSVRITDFGIAKYRHRLAETNHGVAKGKFSYMAPEQIRDPKCVDRRADIFALGIVLWEATLGKPLFRADTEYKTMERVLNMPIPSPTDVDPTYPKALSQIIVKALQRTPEERFATGREMADALRQAYQADPRFCQPALEAFMAGPTMPPRLTTQIPEESYTYEASPVRPRPMVARRRIWPGIAAVALLSLGLGFGAAQWGSNPQSPMGNSTPSPQAGRANDGRFATGHGQAPLIITANKQGQLVVNGHKLSGPLVIQWPEENASAVGPPTTNDVTTIHREDTLFGSEDL